jgi:hypothetical protein
MKTKEEIKSAVDLRYNTIKICEDDLKLLREECKHEETERVNYMWAPGHIIPNTLVCSICGKVLYDHIQYPA